MGLRPRRAVDSKGGATSAGTLPGANALLITISTTSHKTYGTLIEQKRHWHSASLCQMYCVYFSVQRAPSKRRSLMQQRGMRKQRTLSMPSPSLLPRLNPFATPCSGPRGSAIISRPPRFISNQGCPTHPSPHSPSSSWSPASSADCPASTCPIRA